MNVQYNQKKHAHRLEIDLSTEEIQQLKTSIYDVSTDIVGGEITNQGKDGVHFLMRLLRPLIR